MKKIVLTASILITTTFANAVPNVWLESLRQGGYEVKIESVANDKLDVGCYIDSPPPKWHTVEVTYKGKVITNTDKKQPLSFFINDLYAFKPSPTSSPYEGTAHWNEFIDSLVIAKKIEVYNNNKIIFTVYPRNGKEIKDVEGCHIN